MKQIVGLVLIFVLYTNGGSGGFFLMARQSLNGSGKTRK